MDTYRYIPYIKTYGKPFTNYAEILDQEAADQMSNVMAHERVIRGALMPDAHYGYTLPIGGVVACKDMVFPSFVGSDIGCGVLAQEINIDPELLIEKRYDIRDAIKKAIPLGKKDNKENSKWPAYETLPKTDWFNWAFHAKRGLRQLGVLGGGNHFIELGVDEHSDVWIIIHSGSGIVGATTAANYITKAHPENLLKEGVFGLDINTQEGKDYITDMNITLAFALANRKLICTKVIDVLKTFTEKVEPEIGFINRHHNHAYYDQDLDLWIHRKGATHAEKDMLGIIPGNMLDGSFIVKGKGNIDALKSSSHGAGRIIDRKTAKETGSLVGTLTALEANGVATTIDDNSIDEAPFAYKSIYEVIDLQKDLIEVVAHVKPKVVVKG